MDKQASDKGAIEPDVATAKRSTRRQLLKSALVVGGAGALAMGPLGGGILDAAAAESRIQPRPSTGGKTPTAGTVHPIAANAQRYWYAYGQDFRPLYSSDAYSYSGTALGMTPGSIIDYLKRLDLPQGATISSIWFRVLRNDTNADSFHVWQQSTTDGLADLISPLTTSQSSAYTWYMATIPTPIVIDNSTYTYALDYVPGAASSAHALSGAWVSYYVTEGFNLFTAPARVYGTGTVLAPGASVTVDATKKLDGTASGVPVGATAAYCAISSYGVGAISLYPQGSANPGIGAWAAQASEAGTYGVNQSYNMVPLNKSNGQFTFTNYFTSKAMYFDVWGFVY
jgi:hypothetical protein